MGVVGGVFGVFLIGLGVYWFGGVLLEGFVS